MSLSLESPGRWKNVHARLALDKHPRFHFVDQGIQLHLHRLPILSLKRTLGGHIPIRIILIVPGLGSLGGEDAKIKRVHKVRF